MDQQTLPGMPEAQPAPAVPILSRLITVECSYLPDGGGTLVLVHQVPDEDRSRRVTFLPHGTDPRLWCDLVLEHLHTHLVANVEPF